MGQIVVITGCADGMGRHVAKMLAGRGHSVAGFEIDSQGLASLNEELVGDHLLDAIDITNRPTIMNFRDRVLSRFGHVDTVLSNVGIGFFSPFEEVDLEKAPAPLAGENGRAGRPGGFGAPGADTRPGTGCGKIPL